MNTIDITKTSDWNALKQHKDALENTGISLREYFSNNPERSNEMTFSAGDLHIDLSKNLVKKDTLDLLVNLANTAELPRKIKAMYSGEKINVTEGRSVLHTALRRPKTDSLIVDGQDVVKDVHEVLDSMYKTAESIRGGDWRGATGKKITTIVNIGIGGSDLGPVMCYEALKPYANAGIEARFVSNIDPNDIAEKVFSLNPETTLFIIASKTFTTLETMTNAKATREWFTSALKKQNPDFTDSDLQNAITKHFVAVSTALDKVAEFGIDTKNAFGFWSWVGGRYSVDSAIGLSLIISLGPDVFQEFLSGLHKIDTYFEKTPLEQNVVALMGLINVWYVDFFGYKSHAVLPYCQYLHRFPAYLQQLTMESNGKSVHIDGTPATTQTGEVFFGEPGTNGQHAFYQLLHQGTCPVPADFIAFAKSTNPVSVQGANMHELFLANFFAQTKALAFGKTADEVRQENVPESLVPAKSFPGNRPTTSIFAPALTPSVLGQLIALYEHITFVQGVVWGINSFDQFGVELGKKLALELAGAIEGDAKKIAEQDSSTANLIKFYLENK
jgi:glucose-6-phosphate isomerase